MKNKAFFSPTAEVGLKAAEQAAGIVEVGYPQRVNQAVTLLLTAPPARKVPVFTWRNKPFGWSGARTANSSTPGRGRAPIRGEVTRLTKRVLAQNRASWRLLSALPSESALGIRLGRR